MPECFSIYGHRGRYGASDDSLSQADCSTESDSQADEIQMYRSGTMVIPIGEFIYVAHSGRTLDSQALKHSCTLGYVYRVYKVLLSAI